MSAAPLLRVKTITEFHRFSGLPEPLHPLISVIDVETLSHPPNSSATYLVLNFYSISHKRQVNGKIKYGQQEYDFDEGIMFSLHPDRFSVFIDKNEQPGLQRYLCVFSRAKFEDFVKEFAAASKKND